MAKAPYFLLLVSLVLVLCVNCNVRVYNLGMLLQGYVYKAIFKRERRNDDDMIREEKE